MATYCKTLTELSGRTGEDRHALSAALSAPGAPKKTRRGWKVLEVSNWFLIRRLEGMTDKDFESMCTEAEAEPFDPETFFDPDNARRMLAEIRQQGRQAMIAEMRAAL